VLRYYLLSTVIVCTVILVGALFVHRASVAIKIASVYASVPPKPIDEARLAGTAPPFSGEAPWALSALPECFHQRSEITGPRDFVLAHMPAGIAVQSAVLHASDCTLTIASPRALVTRGSDRLRLADSSFYRIGADLGVLHRDGRFAEFRRYRVK
jgi:hypothetical protein